MELRNKNPDLTATILHLRKGKAPVWRAAAEALNRPRRMQFTVTLHRLEKYGKPGAVVVVPGTVLSGGVLSKPLTVGACKFSAAAQQQIEQAGGACLTLVKCMEKYPAGKGVRLMG